MLFSSLTLLIAAPPLAVFGGVLPADNGVIDGAPPNVHIDREVTQGVLGIPGGDVVTQVGSMRYVENSGVCGETPPESTASLYAHRRTENTNVYSASGYADLTSTDHMFFWFFAARNKPDAAPLTLWLNGGVRHFGYLNPVVKYSISQSPEVLP